MGDGNRDICMSNQTSQPNKKGWKFSEYKPISSYISFIFKFILHSSLRNGIKTNAVNWKNCTMYVQDIIFPGTNIVAEIPKDEAYNFQKMCSLFATANSYGKLIDEYVLRYPLSQSTNQVNGSNAESTPIKAVANTVDDSSEISMQNLKDALKFASSKAKSPKPSTSDSPSSFYTSTLDNECQKVSNDQNGSNQTMEKLIYKRTDFHIVYDTVLERNGMLLIEKLDYERFKTEIISILTGYVEGIDTTLDLVPFGSYQYNLYESGSNFNLFIFTGTFSLFFREKKNEKQTRNNIVYSNLVD